MIFDSFETGGKMLYVFHVDTGCMLTFEMNLALETVVQLKQTIELECSIPADKQVLLVSGGECLDSEARVGSYSAGTDTNPIFLFSKSTIESPTPPTLCHDFGSEVELKEKVDASNNLPPTIHAVVVRSQLAQQFYELARDQTKICEDLVHDQHLQQLGWSAVIANLDDVLLAFKQRCDLFEQSFCQYLETKDDYAKLLDSFKDDLETLSHIPILPSLLDENDEERGRVEKLAENKGSDVSLLEWIAAKDNQSSLEQLAEQCHRGLEQFREDILIQFKQEIAKAVETANSVDLREIKGLEGRLCGLEQLMNEVKKIVQEQMDLAQAFSQNQVRACNLGDTSILPDLCTSHCRQLEVMLMNHQKIRDIRRRCNRAKEELSVNLYHRLKGVMFVENRICEMDSRLVLHHENLKRLRKHLEVVQQLHHAPRMYLSAVSEVVRRRSFSEAFLVWANELACQLLAVHSEEIERRNNFQAEFEGHFLSSLFPGFEDQPPSFATQAPTLFDRNLPKLSIDDMEQLRHDLPQNLAMSVTLPDINSITQFFSTSSEPLLKQVGKNIKRSFEEQLVDVTSVADIVGDDIGSSAMQPDSQTSGQSGGNTQPITDRGFESETDTEEFEKVDQSPTDLTFDAKQRGKCKKRNCDILKNEGSLMPSMDSLNSFRIAARKVIIDLRNELKTVKDYVISQQAMLDDMKKLETAYSSVCQIKDSQVLTLQKEIEGKDDHIAELTERMNKLETQISDFVVLEEKFKEEIETSKQKLLDEKEAALKELGDRLNLDHKREMEGLRSRYRLYACTNMERSPSDSSLEKIERSDVIEIANHEKIISQLQSDFMMEKEKLVSEEREKWVTKLEEAKVKSDAERQVWFNEAMRRVTAEKERQLERSHKRELALTQEYNKFKDILQKFKTQSEHKPCPLLSSLETMETGSITSSVEEPKMLESSFSLAKDIVRKHSGSLNEIDSDSSASISAISESGWSMDNSTSSPSVVQKFGHKDKSTKPVDMTCSLLQDFKISVKSCNIGDEVVVLWDPVHTNYVIYQVTSKLHFLHPDSLAMLDLKTEPDHLPEKLFIIALVIEKEHCVARKPSNRYRVKVGEKFYRVKVTPTQAFLKNQPQSSQ
ncbi:uncharacterized protein Atg17 isoform X2 [Bemisia tabaci]|uniref:uncharacterized protein Atg17 isoform X2 n=1 Tax=Bemisia tabaci TaxID=7038 RepID=UPI0008F9E3FF|nr:PREDICTED: RB1-inducible coiled-coil protein 1 isoform X2 [Bemisia tabaci]